MHAVERPPDEIKEFLEVTEDAAEPEIDEADASAEAFEPDILFTSLVGSKGLSAEHVFIVGMNEGHFPRRGEITDDEVCTFLVALSRTRKRCHVISDGFLGRTFLNESEAATARRSVPHDGRPRWHRAHRRALRRADRRR